MENKETGEKSIVDMKVKTTDLCINCGKELKTMKLGSGDLFGFATTGTGAFYCENLDCNFYGYLTVGRKVRTEKVVELKENEK